MLLNFFSIFCLNVQISQISNVINNFLIAIKLYTKNNINLNLQSYIYNYMHCNLCYIFEKNIYKSINKMFLFWFRCQQINVAKKIENFLTWNSNLVYQIKLHFSIRRTRRCRTQKCSMLWARFPRQQLIIIRARDVGFAVRGTPGLPIKVCRRLRKFV